MKVFDAYRPAPFTKEWPEVLISVIVAVYNIETCVERGVASLMRQSYRNLEIILVDDGSTDGSGEICDRLAGEDDRIKVLHKRNGGLADARNAGLAAAKGELIGFLDGDDWIDEDMYRNMAGALLEQQADAAVCRYRRVYQDHTVDDSTDRMVLLEGQETLQYYVEEREEYDIQNAAWNKLYRREILKELWFPAGKWYEDIPFTTIALSRTQRCVYLDSACYNYIIDREESIMNAGINARTFTDQIPAYWEKTEFLRSIGRPELADTHDYFVYKRLLLFYNEIKKGNLLEKEKYLKEIIGIIKGNRQDFERIYQCSAANPNEKRKMDLFLLSPKLYWIAMRLNENVILPIKMRLRSR